MSSEEKTVDAPEKRRAGRTRIHDPSTPHPESREVSFTRRDGSVVGPFRAYKREYKRAQSRRGSLAEGADAVEETPKSE